MKEVYIIEQRLKKESKDRDRVAKNASNLVYNSNNEVKEKQSYLYKYRLEDPLISDIDKQPIEPRVVYQLKRTKK